jgi:hypothetical protein
MNSKHHSCFVFYFVFVFVSCSSPGGDALSPDLTLRLNTIQRTADSGHLIQAISSLTSLSDSLARAGAKDDLQLAVALKQADLQNSYCFAFRSGFDTATRFIRRLGTLHPKSLGDSLEATVLNTTGFYYYLLALLEHADTMDSALRVLNTADSIYTALNNASGSGRALFYTGLCYQNNPDTTRNDYGLAEDYFRRSLKLSIAAGDKITESYAARHLAGICLDRRRYDSALTFAVASWRLREETGLYSLRPYTIGLIGDIYQPQNTDSAKKYHLMALRYADTLGYPPAIEAMHQSLAADDSLSGRRLR